MSYFRAPALTQLVRETNVLFPRRDDNSDGWIGDASHAARKSSHNPCWTCAGRMWGIVLGQDIDIDDGDPGRDLRRMLLNELIGDPRVWYVISNGIIYSRTYGWAALKYDGYGHFGHLHVSLRETESAAFDTRPWFGPAAPAKSRTRMVDLSNVQEQFTKDPLEFSMHVLRVEKALRDRMSASIIVDGYAKRETRFTYQAWQQHVKSDRTDGIPTGYDLRLLGAGGRFGVVA